MTFSLLILYIALCTLIIGDVIGQIRQNQIRMLKPCVMMCKIGSVNY